MNDPDEILDRMTDAFFALDEAWRFTYLNDEGRKIVRRAADGDAAPAELRGERIWDVLPEADGTRFHEKYREAMRTQEPVTFEARYDPLDAWFEVHAYPSESGLSVYFRDVTDRKRLRDDLRRRDATFREMYRVVADKEASFERKVERLFAIGRDALGVEYAALSRVSGDDYVFEIVHDPAGETRAGDEVPLAETNCERAIVTEETLVAADVAEAGADLTDRAGYVERGIRCYIGTPVVVDGEVDGTFCFYDPTAREAFSEWEVTLVELMGNWVSYEQERRRREEELTRERDRLDDFAHIISHDLRNPLNLAAGRLEMARENCEGEADGDGGHLAAVGDAHERIEAIVEDTLTLARQGRTVADAEAVDLGELAGECWGMVETDRADFEAVDAPVVRADPARLRHVLENLFRNAVEHGSTSNRPTGDDVHQTASDAAQQNPTNSADAVEHAGADVSVRVGALDGESRSGFYVADDGPGVPESERERVFETGHTTADDGTGFGLAIVAQVAEAHGWSVEVTESDAGGARFEFRGVE